MLNKSSKKGQATTFMILGIVIAAVVILLFVMRGQFLFGPITPESVEQKGMDPIRDHVTDCVTEIGDDLFVTLGMQGGYLSTPVDTYRKIDGVPVSYLCYNMEDAPTCYNRYLTRADMEGQIGDAVKNGLATCLNVQKFTRGFDASIGNFEVVVDVGDYKSIVTLNMPVSLTKGDVTVTENEFVRAFDIPLGALYEVAQDIIEVEALAGDFEQLSYMLAYKGQFVIEKNKPYPDKLYIITSKDSDYVFQFFVQGEPAS